MNNKQKTVQLIGSDTLQEEKNDTSSFNEGGNDLAERIGTLQEKVSSLEGKKFIELNFESAVFAGLIVIVVSIFIWVLFDKYNDTKAEISELYCKNNTLVDCYGKCSLRDVIIKHNNCETSNK